MSVQIYESNTSRAGHFLGLVLASVKAQVNPDSGIAILCGSGVPAGATYGGQTLAAGQNAIALNADAATVGTVMYFTVNGGTGWTVFNPTGVTDFGAGGLKTDLIVESTAAAGVTVEGLKIEDQQIDTSAVPVTWTHTATHAADDLAIAVLGALNASLHLSSAGTGADAVSVTASAGGIDINSAAGLDVDVTGAVAVDVVGAVDISASGAITIDSSAGSITIGGDAVAQPVRIASDGIRPITIGSAVANGMALDAGTGPLSLSTDAGLTVSAGDLDITSANASAGWTHSTNGAAQDLTFTVAGATDSSFVVASAGTGADAIDLTASAGGIDIDAAGALDIDTAGAITIDSSAAAISIGGNNVAQNLNLGTGGARAISLGSAASASLLLEAGVGAVDMNADTTIDVDAGGAITIDSSAGAISIGADAVAQALNLGTGAAARVITVGNAASANMVLEAGVGTMELDADGAITIESSAGTIGIGVDAVAQAVNIATGAAARAIQIGNAASASLGLEAGVGALTANADTTVDVNAGGAITIDSTGAAISIGADADAQAVNIATGAAARVITIGNAASASLALEAGVGGLTVNADTTIDINGGGLVTIDSTGGAISIGADANAQAVNIGTGAAARVLSIGNAASASLALEAGVGSLTMAADVDIQSTSRLTTTDAVAAGTARIVGGVAYQAVNGASLTSAGGAPDAETVFNLGSYTLPAGTIKAGTVVKLRAVVLVSDGAAGASLTCRCRLGGVAGTVVATGASVNPAANDYAYFDVELTGTAAPGAGANVTGLGVTRDLAAPGADTLSSLLTGAPAATNGALDLVLTGQWTGAAGDDANIRSMTVEVIG